MLSPSDFFTELERTIFSFMGETNNKTRWLKLVLNNKRTAGGIPLPDLKLYYETVVIKTTWYWHKKRHVDQWNQHVWALDFVHAGKKPQHVQHMMLVKLDDCM